MKETCHLRPKENLQLVNKFGRFAEGFQLKTIYYVSIHESHFSIRALEILVLH